MCTAEPVSECLRAFCQPAVLVEECTSLVGCPVLRPVELGQVRGDALVDLTVRLLFPDCPATLALGQVQAFGLYALAADEPVESVPVLEYLRNASGSWSYQRLL